MEQEGVSARQGLRAGVLPSVQGREGQTAVMGRLAAPRGAWECMDTLGSAPRSPRASPGTKEGSD